MARKLYIQMVGSGSGGSTLPRRFREMVRIAERLAAGLDHVRVDMYECDEEIYVGEMTLYSHSGHHHFEPDWPITCSGPTGRLRPKRMRALWTSVDETAGDLSRGQSAYASQNLRRERLE